MSPEPYRASFLIAKGVTSKQMQPNLSTVRDHLYWAYANLAMANNALDRDQGVYSRYNKMVRTTMWKHLSSGKKTIGSFYKDERDRALFSERVCNYCGVGGPLAQDHVLPRKLGGDDRPENLVLACPSCNSSKGKRDMLEWMKSRSEFLPLMLIKRYLKLLYHFCDQQRLLDLSPDALAARELPFSLHFLPFDYPDPSQLRWFPQAAVRKIRPERCHDPIGELAPGQNLKIRGGFSLIELLDYLSAQIGPARLSICITTLDEPDLSHLAELVTKGRLQIDIALITAEILLDAPEVGSKFSGLCQQGRVLYSWILPQLLLLRNDSWHVVIESDIGLIHNRRVATFVIREGAEALEKAFNETVLPTKPRWLTEEQLWNELAEAMEEDRLPDELDSGIG